MQAIIKYTKADKSVSLIDSNGDDVSIYVELISDDSTETKIQIVCDPEDSNLMELPE